MDAKKDPGKFTIRFCMSDPRQREAADELNAQGRLKAQFLTNAILYYAGKQYNGAAISKTELEPIVRAILQESVNAEHTKVQIQAPSAMQTDAYLTDDTLSAITGTLKAFRG